MKKIITTLLLLTLTLPLTACQSQQTTEKQTPEIALAKCLTEKRTFYGSPQPCLYRDTELLFTVTDILKFCAGKIKQKKGPAQGGAKEN